MTKLQARFGRSGMKWLGRHSIEPSGAISSFHASLILR